MTEIMTESEIRHYYGYLTSEQQEAYEDASSAFRKARDLVTGQINDALELANEQRA